MNFTVHTYKKELVVSENYIKQHQGEGIIHPIKNDLVIKCNQKSCCYMFPLFLNNPTEN